MASRLLSAIRAFRNPDQFQQSAGGLPTADTSDVRTEVDFPNVAGRFEIRPGARKTVNKKAKYICGRMGIGRAMTARLPRYITPVVPVPITSDSEWNKMAEEAFHTWSDEPFLCDLARTKHFGKLQKTYVQNMFRSGEAFSQAVKTSELGFPKLQSFDDTQVGGLPDMGIGESLPASRLENFYDGIEYANDYSPRNYVVKRERGERGFLVPAQFMHHVYDPERIGQGRGVSWLYAGVDSAVDALDLEALEKGATKLHSALAVAVKSRSGTDDGQGLNRRFKDLAAKVGADSEGSSSSSTQKFPLLDEIQGVIVKYLNVDEELELLSSNRPSQTWLGFMDYLMRDIAWSFGVPVEFVWSLAGLNGSNTRTILSDSQSFFEDVQDLLVMTLVKRVYTRVIASQLRRYQLTGGREGLRPCEDPRWWMAEYHGPAKITIDNKNDTKSDIERLKNGMLTHEDYWRSRNKDPRVQRTRQIEWLKETMEECEDKGVPFGLFLQANPGTPGLEEINGKVDELDDKKKDKTEEDEDE